LARLGQRVLFRGSSEQHLSTVVGMSGKSVATFLLTLLALSPVNAESIPAEEAQELTNSAAPDVDPGRPRKRTNRLSCRRECRSTIRLDRMCPLVLKEGARRSARWSRRVCA